MSRARRPIENGTTSNAETPEGLKDEEGTQKGHKHAVYRADRTPGGEPDFAPSSTTPDFAPSSETPGGYVGQAAL